MNQNSLNILELEKIKDEVKKYAATSLGKEIIARLNPIADYAYVKASLAELTVGKEILIEQGIPPFGGIRDLRTIIQKVEKGIVLSSKELMDVRITLGGFKSLKVYFQEIIKNTDPKLVEKRFSLITDKALHLEILPELEKKIDRCLDEFGEIKDTASNKLHNLRSEVVRIENKVKERMDSISRSSKYQTMFQDKLITKREDRYVFPVKHEYRNTFAGIVHDQSSSGLTLFMEPLAIVKLNNRLRELKREEEKEIYRILQELTRLIQLKLEFITTNLEIASLLDVIFAKAEYSQAIGGIAPDINENGVIRICSGRHPLLKTDAVPIDISVGDKFTTLLITGSNTGGKTVALKTVGLFILMVESGLHIPAKRGTEIAIFKEVFADIGDEQSIEQNLSTFSSHVNKIKSFLNKADQNSLVLFDELGAGTDPKEGAALGIAILERLRKRKVTTIATTHYSQLKSYAYSQAGVENASVEFDLNSLQPTYRLLMGVPGGSNALAIALRLGISEEIITDAKKLLTGQEIEIEKIITGLNAERKRYQELKEEFLQKERKIKKLEEEYQSLITTFKEKKQNILKEAHQSAKEIIIQTKKETRNLIQELKKQDFSSRSEVDRVANQINESLKTFNQVLDNHSTEIEKEQLIDQTITIGDQVSLKSLRQKGEVLDIDKEKNEAIVRVGIMTVTIGLDDLVKLEFSEENKRELVRNYQIKKSTRVFSNLDLRGERYDLAQRRLDKYLDDVFLAGLKQVEIIHGKGKGILREAVKEILKNNPHISSYRLGKEGEGGSGVTIVTLND